MAGETVANGANGRRRLGRGDMVGMEEGMVVMVEGMVGSGITMKCNSDLSNKNYKSFHMYLCINATIIIHLNPPHPPPHPPPTAAPVSPANSPAHSPASSPPSSPHTSSSPSSVLSCSPAVTNSSSSGSPTSDSHTPYTAPSDPSPKHSVNADTAAQFSHQPDTHT